jgi:hypothetical protein
MSPTARPPRAPILELLKLLPQAGGASVAGLVLLAIAQAALPLAIIAATGVVVARVTEGPRLGAVAAPIAVPAASLVLQQVLSPLLGALQHRATSRMDGALRTRAMEAAARPLGVGLLEDQAIQDRLEVAAGKPSIFRAATPGAAAVTAGPASSPVSPCSPRPPRRPGSSAWPAGCSTATTRP